MRRVAAVESMLRPLAALAVCAGLFAIAPGCANYRLGTGAKLTFTSLYIAPVGTKILLPQAQAIVTDRIRTAFLRDGRVTLVNSPEAAEATLTVEITDYRREVATQRRDDTGLARKFALTLGVQATLTDRRSGAPLFTKRELSVRRDAFTDSGQSLSSGSSVSGQLQSEYQSVPLLADAVAEKIAHAVLDVW